MMQRTLWSFQACTWWL